jgi:hypothetical protein
MNTFNYTKTANLSILQEEIENSSITIAIDNITALVDDITIVFKANLSENEQTTLNTIVNNHVYSPDPQEIQQVELANQKDIDNAVIARFKAAKAGWTYHMSGVEFQTSTINSFYHKDVNGNDLNEAWAKYYDVNNNELTTQGSCDTDCVKTVLTFEPPWDYEIIGGTLKTISAVTSDMRVWIIAVPDIPANLGGSKVMVQNINLIFIDPNNGIVTDGRASKYMTYNAVYHTNKLQFTLKHTTGYKERVMIAFELFRA